MQDGVWHAVCAVAEIETGGMMPVEIGDLQIAVYNVGGDFFATDNICSHGFALLTDGLLEDDRVECPLHGACFNVRTGKVECEPAETDLAVYRIRLAEGRIEICVPG